MGSILKAQKSFGLGQIQPVKRYQTRTWVNNNQVPRPHRTLATVHDSIPMTGTEKLPVLSFEWKGHFNRLHAPKGQPYPITCSCIVVNCIIVHHCHCKGLRLRLVISGLVTLFKCPITQCDQWKMGFAGGQIWSANEGRDSSGLRTGPFVNQLVEIFWSNTIQKTIRKMKITLFLLNSIITDTK